MNQNGTRYPSRTRAMVLVAVSGSIIFAIVLGYIAWTNSSFPLQRKPFGDYAQVTVAVFNGTEYAFQVRWLSPDYLPLYAQMTSSTDVANSPVCDLGLRSVDANQAIFMPFGISRRTDALTNVDLSIAVRPSGGGSEFTIVYHVDSAVAEPGIIVPSDIVCGQSGPRM